MIEKIGGLQLSSAVMNAIEVDVAGEESVIALYVGMDVINRLESDKKKELKKWLRMRNCLLYTSPSPRDRG